MAQPRWHQLVLLALALTSPILVAATPCDQWQLANPLPTEQDLLGSAYGSSRFVVVGRAGTVLTSPDELAWQLEPVAATADLHAVTWRAGRFVAVGSGGTVLTSPDGRSWTAAAAATEQTLLGIAGDGPLMVAVGAGGTILTSADGANWTVRDASIDTELRAVVWTGREYLAVGDGNAVLASPQGVDWTPREIGLDGPFTSIASHDGTTLVVAADGRTAVTADGDQWRQGFASTLPGTVSWLGDRFVALDRPAASFDGLSWWYTQVTAPGLELVTTASDGTIAIAAGRHGVLAVTRDRGEHWKPVNTPAALDLHAIADDGATAVLAAGWGNHSSGALLASSDLLNWDVVYQRDLESFYGAARGDGWFVAVGVNNELWTGGAMILRSADGREWSNAVGTVTSDGGWWPWVWYAVTWDGARFVAAGSSGSVGISSDAWHWTAISLESEDQLTGVASDGATIVAVGGEGVIAVSDGAGGLMAVDPGTTGLLTDVAWGDGTFVVVGAGGLVLTSADGTTWLEHSSGSDADLQRVRFTGDRFVAVGDTGAVLTSSDGSAWQALGNARNGGLLDVAWRDPELVVVGRDGVVARTACAVAGEPPAARFAWRPTLPEVGTPVRFVDLSAGGPTDWVWHLGDGTTATGPAVTWTYQEAGVWPVTLIAGNDAGADGTTSDVTVRRFCGAPPAAVLTAPATAASGTGYEVSWDPTLAPGEWGDYLIAEATDPDFATASWLGLLPATTSYGFSHQWSEGAVFYYRFEAVNNCPDGWYRSPGSNVVRVEIEPDLADLGEHVEVIPAAAHGPGLRRTSWVSDVVIHNPHPQPVPAYLVMVPRVGEGSPSRSARMWLEAGRSLRLDDAVAAFADPGFGALLVASDHPLLVASRTYNDRPEGTFGQYIGGTPLTAATGAGDEARIIQLTRNDGFRTNLGFANPRPDEISITARLHSADGTLLATRTYDLPGLSSLLDVDALAEVAGGQLPDAYAVVSTTTPDAAYVAFASVVDAATGDPVAQPSLLDRARHRTVSRPGLLPDSTNLGARRLADTGTATVLLADHALLASRDGVEWRVGWEFEGLQDRATDVASGDGLVLAVGAGWLWTSSDGFSWSRSALPGFSLDSIAWSGDRWLGVGGAGGSTTVATSLDGVSWDVDTLDGYELRDVVWAVDRFLAITPTGVATSRTGNWWPRITVAGIDTSRPIAAAWNGTTLIALGRQQLAVSDDGSTWHTSSFDLELQQVVWTGEWWVVTARSLRWGEGSAFLVSRDGIDWVTVPNPGSQVSQQAAAWDGTNVVSVDFDGTLSWLISDRSVVTVPAVAHLAGLGGSHWRSDLELHNPHDRALPCTIDLLERGRPNLAPRSVAVTVAPESSLALPDILESAFGSHGAGALRLRPAEGTLLVSSRTYDDTPAGTFGQMVPALRATDAVWPFESARLIQLVHSPRASEGSRTNIGLVSDCARPMEVTVELYLGSGEPLGDLLVALPAFAPAQLSNVFESVTTAPVADGFAILATATPRCSFHAYASVVDNRSNDPILIPAVPWTTAF